jgi:hypothetical protein
MSLDDLYPAAENRCLPQHPPAAEVDVTDTHEMGDTDELSVHSAMVLRGCRVGGEFGEGTNN